MPRLPEVSCMLPPNHISRTEHRHTIVRVLSVMHSASIWNLLRFRNMSWPPRVWWVVSLNASCQHPPHEQHHQCHCMVGPESTPAPIVPASHRHQWASEPKALFPLPWLPDTAIPENSHFRWIVSYGPGSRIS